MARNLSSNSLKLFNRDSFPVTSFIALFLLCLIMMGTDYRQQILKKIKSKFSIVSSPITFLINLPVTIFNDSKDVFITKTLLKERIKNLQKTNYALSIAVQENKLLTAENNILRDTLKIKKDFNLLSINAEIVLPKVRNGYSIITINKGLNHKIKTGSAVINNAGLVGQIINTSKSHSEIIPITSENYAVPAIMDNSKENVILYGNGNGGLEIPLFPSSSSILINDTFVTSGVGGLYPKGINIGKVVEIKKTTSPKFNSIVITPFSQPVTFTQISVLDIKE